MAFDKKRLASIVALGTTLVYALHRWRGDDRNDASGEEPPQAA